MISSPRKRRLGTLSVFSACTLILGVFAASPASALTSCSKAANVLNVVADTNATLVRSGDNILVNGASCGANTTVNDIDEIDVTSPNPGTTNDNVTIDLSGGKFAPGLNNEVTGQSEIEITVDLRAGTNTLTILGTPSTDRWTFLAQGIDLNSDGDADVTGKPNGSGGFLNLSDPALAVTANGQSGNDTFYQKEKTTETLVGGDGAADAVEYKLRTAGLNVTLDGAANDGESAENDNVGTDVEIIRGGSGNDILTGTTGSQLLYGYLGNDTLTGADGADVLNGGSGLPVGDDGTDTLNGGGGGDVLNGGSNNDTINGGLAADNVTDGPGSDTVDAGANRDLIYQDASANGSDVIDGGSGVDTISYSKRSASLNITLDDVQNDGASGELDNVKKSVENIQGGKANDVLDASADTGVAHNLTGGAGGDTITGADLGDNLNGGDGVDTIQGNGGSDRISGGDLGDTLSGNGGADTIFGDDGADQIHGGIGSDRLYGGGGTGDNDLCEDPDAKTIRTGCESK
jgi:Ca2+-binding RTX toxin-like protein